MTVALPLCDGPSPLCDSSKSPQAVASSSSVVLGVGNPCKNRAARRLPPGVRGVSTVLPELPSGGVRRPPNADVCITIGRILLPPPPPSSPLLCLEFFRRTHTVPTMMNIITNTNKTVAEITRASVNMLFTSAADAWTRTVCMEHQQVVTFSLLQRRMYV